jgi:Fur family ferric uptake transcriptional regulator
VEIYFQLPTHAVEMPMKTPLGRLRAQGLRVTTGRILVLQAIEESPRKGLGAEDVYHELLRCGTPMSLASVYRIMKDLTQEGIFKRCWNGEGDDIKYAYWLRSDEEAACHNHLICTRCQRSVRIDNPVLENEILRQAQTSGMAPGLLQFTIQVTCLGCANHQKEPVPPS